MYFCVTSIQHVINFNKAAMGKAPEGIFGAVKGKVGNLVWYTVNGEARVRMAPSKRRGKKTVKEKANTGKFAKVQEFLSPISDYLKIGYKDYGTKTGGYKGAVSYALQNAIAGEYPEQFVDPEKVRVCGGELHFPISAAVVLDNSVLRFTWSTEDGENGNAYDQVFMLAYAPAVGKTGRTHVCGQPTGAFRIAGVDELLLSPGKKTIDYHVYMGFVARDRSCQAHSLYLGVVTVPGT